MLKKTKICDYDQKRNTLMKINFSTMRKKKYTTSSGNSAFL